MYKSARLDHIISRVKSLPRGKALRRVCIRLGHHLDKFARNYNRNQNPTLPLGSNSAQIARKARVMKGARNS